MAVSVGVYGFVVSFVLVAAIAGGAVYINNLKLNLNVCKETHNNVDITALKTFTNEFNVVYRDAPNDPQKIQLNTLTKTEIFIQNGTVAVFDFLKNIGGFYTSKHNRCFLVGGIDARIKSPDDLKKELHSMKAKGVAVTDQSFFPEALAPFCKGRPTYWLTPQTHQGKHEKTLFCVILIVFTVKRWFMPNRLTSEYICFVLLFVYLIWKYTCHIISADWMKLCYHYSNALLKSASLAR
ncbi:hypothetical protein NP493_1305g00003 [Ridgeia piscesae]|uniref:BRICHOS domain-containing protein n=1 Tax=Ridgeia piscesae TaxID=27915 RepID=A0AAD9NH04_RIDPI|nr:hypothetical protein NP493_1305g00003 [Ridgeia piscesae]